MQFRDLQRQYLALKTEIDAGIQSVLDTNKFIIGPQVAELEEKLAQYVGVKHCVSCGNGSDALQLALMAWGIGKGDAVFVPDFTYIASAGCAEILGATPVFVDIDLATFNMSPAALRAAIERVIANNDMSEENALTPKAIVAVDLFGQPAEFDELRAVAKEYNLLILEDGAQGFGGNINGKRACSFGDIATTSFFPAKPLGCYGDGGAIFTNDDSVDAQLRSMRVHGRSVADKYDNSIVGMNSRLDTLQAAILIPKLNAFVQYELNAVNMVAKLYDSLLMGHVMTPTVLNGYYSSWAQYTIMLADSKQRNAVQTKLKENGIPSMVYYPRGMHSQTVFEKYAYPDDDYKNTRYATERVLSLPMCPYMTEEEVTLVANTVINTIKE